LLPGDKQKSTKPGRNMSSFAAGERYLNRVWSASTGGYFEEVTTYLSRAYSQFIEVRQKVGEVHEQQIARKS